MAWSLDDRTGPTRPLQVTCTLVVRWWASRDVCPPWQLGQPRLSSAFHGAGELSPALSTRTRRLARQSWKSGASRPRPSCHARTPHRLRAPTTRPEPPNPRLSEDQEETTNTHNTPDLASCAPLHFSRLLAPPSFELLREASRRGALPSRPLPSRRARAEGIVTWPKPREIHSPKMRPLLQMTFDL